MFFFLCTFLIFFVIFKVVETHFVNKKQAPVANEMQLMSRIGYNMKEIMIYKWIVNYIEQRNGKANYTQMKEEYVKFLQTSLNEYIMEMIQDGIIHHHIDPNDMQEYIEINKRETGYEQL